MASTPAARAGPSNAPDTAPGDARAGGGRSRAFNPRGSFIKEINQMMYAFGDVPDPNPASAALLEEMTIDYIVDLCMRARPSPLAVPQVDQSYPPIGRVKVKVDDFKHALRKEPKKLNRLEELLYMDTQIKQTKRTLDVDQFAKDEAEQQQRLFAAADGAQHQKDSEEGAQQSEALDVALDAEDEPRAQKRRKSTAAEGISDKGKGRAQEDMDVD